MMRKLISASLLAIALAAQASDLPYDENADAKKELMQALKQAEQKPVLLVFGANWCKDCRALDAALKSGKNAALLASEFTVVKVDVGNFNRNMDLDTAYGKPTKMGIPAVVMLSRNNEVLYASKGGELADARKMGEEDVYNFFHQIASKAKTAAKAPT